jgi:hypothetical protein
MGVRDRIQFVLEVLSQRRADLFADVCAVIDSA